MSTKVVWKVESLAVMPNDGVHTDVVTRCSWSCIAKQEDREFVVNGNKYFTVNTERFVPFNELSETDVLAWCWEAGLDKNSVEQTAKLGLLSSEHPKEVEMASPWKTEVASVEFEKVSSLQPNP
jgi:hypothetical protein